LALGIPAEVLLNGVPRVERRWGRRRVVGWAMPPVSPTELQMWAAFERVEGPILMHERIDIGQAMTSYVVAAAAGAKEVTVEQFLPKWDGTEAPQRQSAEDIIAVIEGLKAGRDGP
jgi:hypothetical protein